MFFEYYIIQTDARKNISSKTRINVKMRFFGFGVLSVLVNKKFMVIYINIVKKLAKMTTL